MAESPYVTRAGRKLDHALRVFDVDVTELICADFGCNIGGFTDCLLQHGAAKVYAIDTAYGELAWKLRQDSRVVVMERTNALHVLPPSPSGRGAGGEGEGICDLITIDLGWTKQERAIPAAMQWLNPSGRIISLIKPHYEATAEEKRTLMDESGALSDDASRAVFERVLEQLPSLGVRVVETTKSPLRGGKSSRKSGATGNREFLALLALKNNSKTAHS